MSPTEKRQRFRAVLAGDRCVHPASVHDPVSARIAEDLGFELGMFAGSIGSLAVLGAPDIIVLTLTEFAEQARRIGRAGALPLLVDDLLETYPDLSGVLARKEDARGFCALWQERTGATYRLKTAERIFRCIRVIPARPVGGELRRADPAERDLIVEWLIAFTLEALGPDEDVSTVASIADHWLGGAGRWLYIWDDGGPVSMAGASGETPSGIRIGAVYTPPELRGRGYASNCVAAVSQAELDRGRRFCFLFTDLANPTSNKIYRAIGYEPVCDVDEYRFEPGRV